MYTALAATYVQHKVESENQSSDLIRCKGLPSLLTIPHVDVCHKCAVVVTRDKSSNVMCLIAFLQVLLGICQESRKTGKQFSVTMDILKNAFKKN